MGQFIPLSLSPINREKNMICSKYEINVTKICNKYLCIYRFVASRSKSVYLLWIMCIFYKLIDIPSKFVPSRYYSLWMIETSSAHTFHSLAAVMCINNIYFNIMMINFIAPDVNYCKLLMSVCAIVAGTNKYLPTT